MQQFNSYSRRHFLATATRTAGVAGALSIPGRPLLAYLGERPEDAPPITDTRLNELAQRAIDSAVRNGAEYVDVRLTHEYTRRFGLSLNITEEETLCVGVRALVNGYWGFASSTKWRADEMDQLGETAAHIAKTPAAGRSRRVELGPEIPVVNQHWRMPVEIDPFEVHPDEIRDFLRSVAKGTEALIDPPGAEFWKQDKLFASSAGTSCTQQLYRSTGQIRVKLGLSATVSRYLDCLTPAGAGWELFTRQNLRERIQAEYEALDRYSQLPSVPVEIGRYHTVLDAFSVSQLLGETVGIPTELDRILGFEANAGGTSFINDPSEMIGNFKFGSEIMAVTANRSDPWGAATVGWDDEGVAPKEIPLVQNGVLTDVQSTREGFGWIRDEKLSTALPPTSRGCAYAATAIDEPMTWCANLRLAPGTAGGTNRDLYAEMDKGVLVRDLKIYPDFQLGNGLALGSFSEIRGGKEVSQIAGAAILFNTNELWKSLKRVAGAEDAKRIGRRSFRGEPFQMGFYSATAPAALFADTTLIDFRRKG